MGELTFDYNNYSSVYKDTNIPGYLFEPMDVNQINPLGIPVENPNGLVATTYESWRTLADYCPGETLEETIRRIVMEALGETVQKPVNETIERYHLKHK